MSSSVEIKELPLTQDKPNKAVEPEENTNEEPVVELSEVEKLTSDNEKLRNEYLYLRAEFDNFRKNSIKERSDLIKFGPERLANALLEVVDIFDKALDDKIDKDNFDGFLSGIKMTSVELKNTLENFGVKAIDSIGKPFDPNLHEALGSEESSEVEEGHILQVFKKPYKFHDKVMRHGQVVIAKLKTNKEPENISEDDDEIVGFE